MLSLPAYPRLEHPRLTSVAVAISSLLQRRDSRQGRSGAHSLRIYPEIRHYAMLWVVPSLRALFTENPRRDVLGNWANTYSYTRIPIRYQGVGKRACSASFLEEFFSETRSTEGSNLAHNLSPW